MLCKRVALNGLFLVYSTSIEELTEKNGEKKGGVLKDMCARHIHLLCYKLGFFSLVVAFFFVVFIFFLGNLAALF